MSGRGSCPSPGRRRFLVRASAGAMAALSAPFPAWALGSTSAFRWTQLRYPGSWDTRPTAATRFLDVLRRRTSVDADRRRRVLELQDPELFHSPFLYVTGRGSFPQLDEDQLRTLRRYVEHGGFVLFDDATGIPDSGFVQGVADTLERVFPGRPLQPLPADHAVFQSFYLLRDVPGRKIVRPFLYGVELEDLTSVIVSSNDLAGAWDGDVLAGYTYPCTPGGERQREMTFRLGVNLVMYALTGNYKKDQVHIPFILKRRQR